MLFSNGSRIGRKSYIFLRTYLKKMDDFGAPATLPAVSRKRPRYDDQIAEYRDRASKKHAAVLSKSLADAANAAANAAMAFTMPGTAVPAAICAAPPTGLARTCTLNRKVN